MPNIRWQGRFPVPWDAGVREARVVAVDSPAQSGVDGVQVGVDHPAEVNTLLCEERCKVAHDLVRKARGVDDAGTFHGGLDVGVIEEVGHTMSL